MDVPWWLALITFGVGALSGMTFTGSRWMKSYNLLVRRYNNLYNGNPDSDLGPNPYKEER